MSVLIRPDDDEFPVVVFDLETVSVQEEDVNMVEHGGWLSIRRQSHLLPLRSTRVW